MMPDGSVVEGDRRQADSFMTTPQHDAVESAFFKPPLDRQRGAVKNPSGGFGLRCQPGEMCAGIAVPQRRLMLDRELAVPDEQCLADLVSDDPGVPGVLKSREPAQPQNATPRDSGWKGILNGFPDQVSLAATSKGDPATFLKFRECLAKGDTADAKLSPQRFLARQNVFPALIGDQLPHQVDRLIHQRGTHGAGQDYRQGCLASKVRERVHALSGHGAGKLIHRRKNGAR